MSDYRTTATADLEAELRRRHEESQIAKRDIALGVARDMLLKSAGFTCIHDRDKDHPLKYYPYCSGCPVSPVDGKKDGRDYHTLQLICGRSTNYGK